MGVKVLKKSEQSNSANGKVNNIKFNTNKAEGEQEDVIINKPANKLTQITIFDLQKLPKNYDPSKDDAEYMGYNHRVYFYGALNKMRDESVFDIEKINASMEAMRNSNDLDEFDIASKYTELSNSMTQIERLTNLIRKIDKLLRSLQEGSYGFCEETGEPIGIKRLIVRPIATMSVNAQSTRETQQFLAKNSVIEEE